MFVLLLITHFLVERRHSLFWFCCSNDNEEEQKRIAWKRRIKYPYQQIPSSSSSSLEAVALDNVQIDVGGSTDAKQQQQDNGEMWTHEDHIRAALQIAPVWFFANWAYNGSLAYTSITSSTVLASTGSLFTFLFAVVSRDESFTCLKLLGVLLGVSGSILTGLHDVSSGYDGGGTSPEQDYDTIASTQLAPNDDVVPSVMCVAGPSGTPHHIDIRETTDPFSGHAAWGDVLGLLSAIGYGLYAVMIRIKCPRDESKMSMQLLLGYIGLVNAIVLFPVAAYVLLKPSISSSSSGGEDSDAAASVGLTWVVFGYLVAKGTFDNVLSDYLWARAVVLTSATVATVGLGLTIPLAFVSDWIMGHDNVVSIQSILGAISVLAGFILVNIGGKEESSSSGDGDVASSDGEDGSDVSEENDEAFGQSSPNLTPTSSSDLGVTPSASEIADDKSTAIND